MKLLDESDSSLQQIAVVAHDRQGPCGVSASLGQGRNGAGPIELRVLEDVLAVAVIAHVLGGANQADRDADGRKHAHGRESLDARAEKRRAPPGSRTAEADQGRAGDATEPRGLEQQQAGRPADPGHDGEVDDHDRAVRELVGRAAAKVERQAQEHRQEIGDEQERKRAPTRPSVRLRRRMARITSSGAKIPSAAAGHTGRRWSDSKPGSSPRPSDRRGSHARPPRWANPLISVKSSPTPDPSNRMRGNAGHPLDATMVTT